MATLTFYGGVKEIGGNKILLEDSGKRIWFDFGMSFRQSDLYFAEFLQPKKFNGVIDYLKTQLLPELDDMCGFYRGDYLAHCDMKVEEKPSYDAVFLSHAHADHSSYIHFIRHDMPIYASRITKQILYAIEVTSGTGLTDYTNYTETFQIKPKQKGDGYTRVRGEAARSPRNFTAFEELPGSVKVGDVAVEAIPVNHSLPGACGYIVHTSRGAIVYTGDLRFHGYGGKQTEKFVERASKVQPLALMCEGTRIDETSSVSEQEVQEKLAQFMEGKALIIANFPVRDTERMTSFLEVARSTGRRLAISTKQAFLLKQLEGGGAGIPALNDKNIAIYVRRKDWGLITKNGYPNEIVRQDYDDWEREFLSYPNAVTCEDIGRNQTDFIVRIDFFELPDLIALKPAQGSCYIRSVTEPHDDEDLIDLRRVNNWLKLFNLLPYQKIHASGHASGVELKQLISEINPQIIIPIHTEKPELFKNQLREGIQVISPEEGKPYRFDQL
jgi:ribonuclease J